MTYSFFMVWTEKNVPELGACHSWDIVVYDCVYRDPVAELRDVTPDCHLAQGMIEAFNRYGLSAIHLVDGVLDLLE